MAIIHIVLFQFKADASAEDVKELCARFLALKDNCIHPTSNVPYIKSLKAGKDNSPEGLQNGMTHGFVVEFESAEDRDYYVEEDPVHKAFVKSAGIVAKPTVLDFEDGVY
ncbi:dabb-domain-containing protein [Parathielavia hyrcaniae]|uniref:Dabb-domain-containing protein n=1 Tax=Parathielavia hyrcaniae TaxID=113614 RepID=A0AAN6T0W8_9PEZI|nr:dabb-domain-containing protein [Parathielavia hyrcaniae]